MHASDLIESSLSTERKRVSAVFALSSTKIILSAIVLSLSGAASGATPSAPPPLEQRAEEIVVMGNRSGIPIWRVSTPTSTLILVGTIDGVAKQTKWDPAPLLASLQMADQVLFPQMQRVTGSPFAMIGYLAKWRRQATLPKGQSLQDLLSPSDYGKLISLQRRGIVPRGAETRHPLHLAFQLRDATKDKVGYAQGANQYVMRAIRMYKLNLAPLQKTPARQFANDLFGGSPSTHIPCLIDAMRMAEGGAAAVIARSEAWAKRQVPAVLGSAAEGVYQTCFPAQPDSNSERLAAVQHNLNRLLLEPKVTMAVLDLNTLARSGGVLDQFSASGFRVRGPVWKK